VTGDVRLGLRANAPQFALLVALNALVGGMVGLERSVLPLVGKQDFGLSSTSAILAFVVAFGAAKAFTNLAAGGLAQRVGRKRLLVIGWLVALPVPLLIGLAPSWWFIVAANLLLGVNQGLAWSMTVVMKIDLAAPRGLALGLNEAAGYLGVAATAFLTGALAASYAPLTVVWVGAALIVTVGLLVSVFAVRDTGAQVALEQRAYGAYPSTHGSLGAAFAQASLRDPILRACSQAGLVNNLNDAPRLGRAALPGSPRRQRAPDRHRRRRYPVVWGAGQPHRLALRPYGGKPLITAGMLVQAARSGCRRRRWRLRALARRRAAAWRRHGDGLPDPDRRRFGRQPAARPGTRGRRLSLLAGLRLRPRRSDRRDRCRRHLNANRDPDRRRAHRRQRPALCRDLVATAARASSRLRPLRKGENAVRDSTVVREEASWPLRSRSTFKS
jgi:predicted MFS family arabinose efflux permease